MLERDLDKLIATQEQKTKLRTDYVKKQKQKRKPIGLKYRFSGFVFLPRSSGAGF